MENVIKLSDLLDEDYIINLKADIKEDALKELLKVICKNEKITDNNLFEKEIFRREKLMSTGIGYEIAIPHARHKSIKDFVMALGIKKDGLGYDSIDNKPVKLIFMIGAAEAQNKDYLKLLSSLVSQFKNKNFINNVLNAKNSGEIYDLIKELK